MRTRPILAVAVATLLAGCSFEASIGGSGYDVDAIEGIINEQIVPADFPTAPLTVDCADAPDDVAEGLTFTCTGTDTEGTAYQFAVTTTDDDGGVSIEALQ